jgi:hypothetical protein
MVDARTVSQPPITAWLCPRPLEMPEAFLRVCVLASRRRQLAAGTSVHHPNH